MNPESETSRERDGLIHSCICPRDGQVAHRSEFNCSALATNRVALIRRLYRSASSSRSTPHTLE